MITAVKKGNSYKNSLQFAADGPRADREVVLKAVKANGAALEYADKMLVIELKKNKDY